MEVAVCCDCLENIGGGEYDALVLAQEFDADVYTPNYEPDATFPGFRDLEVHETFDFDLPYSKGYALRKMMHSVGFMREDFSDYDVLISIGMWAHFASQGDGADEHYHYDLSPNRGLYDLYEEIIERQCIWQNPTYKVWSSFWSECDQSALDSCDYVISQSETVSERIEKYHNREPDALIYPPVDLDRFSPSSNKEDYWIMVCRVMKEKRIELALDVFEELPTSEKLIVCGGAPDYYRGWEKSVIDRMDGMKNVEYRGRVPDEELADLYAHAKGSLHLGINEDFGLGPPESFISNTPALAVKEGGFRETIITGKNGILIEEPYLVELRKAIEAWDLYDFDDDLVKYAEKYSADRFRREWRGVVEDA